MVTDRQYTDFVIKNGSRMHDKFKKIVGNRNINNPEVTRDLVLQAGGEVQDNWPTLPFPEVLELAVGLVTSYKQAILITNIIDTLSKVAAAEEEAGDEEPQNEFKEALIRMKGRGGVNLN